MANRVAKLFRDKNSKKLYRKGDLYEHSDADRVAFLVDSGYLEAEEVKIKFPKHTGGGWYELSNGEKVQGKDEAAAAEGELHKEGE
ncbi:hypothetical protein [Bacillus sp. AG4(2022)]|uniref:hypothetical protein n=1 Tax=Bacillus sp. AG4(2022) TaxID=2962594 RepID=UPI0028814976|nr:hypothetical protein [Bacillus sp. AG4(2022)]MDT0163824.1 hypothetical protein [Bacillus sp. AG4(2022)]